MGTVESIRHRDLTAMVLLDTDPYPVRVQSEQLEKLQPQQGDQEEMASTTKPSARELRRKAKALGVSGWEDMDRDELAEAVEAAEGSKPARKSTGTKAKAKSKPAAKSNGKSKAKPAAAKAKKAAAEDEDADPTNPYRKGTNMWHITEALKKGGKRSTLVKQLTKKVELNPRKQDEDEMDVEAEIDRRILIVGQILRRDHGFEVVREGRGKDAKIVATPPE